MKKVLKIVGLTDDNIALVSGVFYLTDTRGVPLDFILDALKANGYMPDWLGFREEALRAGWKPHTIRLRLLEAIGDVYGPEFREAWEKRYLKAENNFAE